ncbi:bifunctional metallophosphatase/5'-nucleotidase [Candidatus Dependentiae bacterium]|nr:bifunctional metallophosphatase/5'-nucleotidase [Candidatus Dependentiae bacterium]
MIKKNFKALFIILLFFGISNSAIVFSAEKITGKTDYGFDTVAITFIYTNDIHGQIKPYKSVWLDTANPPLVGGFAVLKKYIDDYKRKNPDKLVVVFDAGDMFQGTPEGDLTDGRIVIDCMNLIGYSAGTLGNHEFDRGEDKLIELLNRVNFKMPAANVECSEKNIDEFVFLDYPEYNLKIAVTGLLTTETLRIIGKDKLKKFKIKKERSSLRKTLKKIKKSEPDLIVCLSHCGTEVDSGLIKRIKEVDIIFGGHDHKGKEKSMKRDGVKTFLLSTYGKLSYAGKFEIVYDRINKTIIYDTNVLVPLKITDIGEDSGMLEFIADKSKDIEKIMDVEVGFSEEDLTKSSEGDSYADSKLGNLLTDILRESGNADLAFYNNSGIRNNILKGKIMFRDVYQIEPFGNTVFTMELKGGDIKEFLSNMVNDGYHSMQMSGLILKYYKSKSDNKYYIESLTLNNGEELKNNKRYKVAVPNYIGGANDGYTLFGKGEEKHDTLIYIRDALNDFVKKNNPYKYNIPPRVIFLGEK